MVVGLPFLNRASEQVFVQVTAGSFFKRTQKKHTVVQLCLLIFSFIRKVTN